jgi:hypothetical protein
MPGTVELPLLPEEATTLGPRLAVVETPAELIFMNASGPLMSCARTDAAAKRFIGAVLMRQGLAKGEDLAGVLGVHRSTLFRNQKIYREGGLDAIHDGRRRANAVPRSRPGSGPNVTSRRRRVSVRRSNASTSACSPARAS